MLYSIMWTSPDDPSTFETAQMETPLLAFEQFCLLTTGYVIPQPFPIFVRALELWAVGKLDDETLFQFTSHYGELITTDVPAMYLPITTETSNPK